MSENRIPKETSYEYGKAHQEAMLEFYYKSRIASETNTEYLRVVLAHELVNKYAMPRLANKPMGETIFVDVGCSVGLFAIDFSKNGYKSYGLDFDPAALEIANKLNSEEGASAEFIRMDVSDWNLDKPIDIALCFDLFEHLHDDELGSLLQGLRRNLSRQGSVVFHTLPLQYDYLFWDQARGIIRFPWLLRLFRRMPARHFSRLVRMYALLLDLVNLSRGGTTHKEAIKLTGHCNPLTYQRLEDILKRAGYEILFMESTFLGEVQLDKRDAAHFHRQPITHRSLRGVAVPKS